MATSSSRIAARRRAVVEEALDHAVTIMTERGVGGLSIVEVARRMQMRGPSLYKYFPSLQGMYDALFARGLRVTSEALHEAVAGTAPGRATLEAAAEAVVGTAVANPALAQLLYWRPIPDFEPSPTTFEISVTDMALLRTHLREAVRREELHPDADSDEAERVWTVLLGGVITLHLSNQPERSYATGDFTRLVPGLIELFFAHYHPRRP